MWIVWTLEKEGWSKAMVFHELSEACIHADYLIEASIYDGNSVFIGAEGSHPTDS